MSERTQAAAEPRAAPDAEQVWHAYQRITASGALRASGQLDSFLKFVISRTLDGEGNRLKAYTIAVEGLGRAPSFDPGTDSFVRVTAGRLRQALAVYYASEGAADPVIITLPKGTYVPSFTLRSQGAGSDVPVPPQVDRTLTQAPARARFHGRAVAGIAVVLAWLAVWVAWPGRIGETLVPPANDIAARAADTSRAGVMVAVHPLEVIGAPSPSSPLVARLRDTLTDAMARFDGVNVVVASGPAEAGAADVDYRLTGRVAYAADGVTTLAFRLTDAASKTVVWSRRIEDRPTEGAVAPAWELSIVSEIVTTVAGPFGVIWTRELAVRADANPFRQCLVETIEYWRRFTLARHAAVRACMGEIVDGAPAFAMGHMALGLVYLRDFYMDRGAPGEAPPLDHALQHAQRAVELRPQSARAHNLFSAVSFARGDVQLALEAGARGMALNPYDTNIVAEYGARLLGSGQVERGMAYLRRASERSVTRPMWFDAYLFIGAYLAGDMETAMRHAPFLRSDVSALGLVARVVAADLAGDRAAADDAVAELLAINPSWREDPRALLAKYYFDLEIQDALLPILRDNGLGS